MNATPDWFLAACEFSVLGCALVSGIFLAFSDFVMRGLQASRPDAAIEAMQMINRKVYRSLFSAMFWGMFLFTIAVAALAWAWTSGPVIAATVGGAVLYAVGAPIVSFARNIPMNDRLDRMTATDPEAIAYWRDRYVRRWTFWNHIRTLTTAGSAAAFLAATVLVA